MISAVSSILILIRIVSVTFSLEQVLDPLYKGLRYDLSIYYIEEKLGDDIFGYNFS